MPGVVHVQGVFGVHEGTSAAHFLAFGDDVQGEGGLARRFGAEDLRDAAARDAAHAQGQVQPQAAGGNGIHLHGGIVAQLHHGTLAELLFDLGQRSGQRILFGLRLGLFGRRGNGVVVLIFCHSVLLLYPHCPQKRAVLYFLS